MKGTNKGRRFSAEFKAKAVRRMMAGEPVAKLSRELKVKRTLLYRWRDAYRKEGIDGFRRPVGRPRLKPEEGMPAAEARIRELERKVGQQAMVIDFLQKACKRVKELRRPSKGPGVTASMERSKP